MRSVLSAIGIAAVLSTFGLANSPLSVTSAYAECFNCRFVPNFNVREHEFRSRQMFIRPMEREREREERTFYSGSRIIVTEPSRPVYLGTRIVREGTLYVPRNGGQSIYVPVH
jgi:hypothetical protein